MLILPSPVAIPIRTSIVVVREVFAVRGSLRRSRPLDLLDYSGWSAFVGAVPAAAESWSSWVLRSWLFGSWPFVGGFLEDFRLNRGAGKRTMPGSGSKILSLQALLFQGR